MDLRGWDERYRSASRAAEDFEAPPTQLVVSTAQRMHPGKALDLACGAGRNALWLAEHGWSVTAVDGAPAAIEILRKRAAERGVTVDTRIADLERHRAGAAPARDEDFRWSGRDGLRCADRTSEEKGEYRIEPVAWDLIVIAYYLQRDLFESAKRGVLPGGQLLSIVHLAEPGQDPGRFSLPPGELKNYFQGWEILHEYEGMPRDAAHHRAVAEIVARRPGG